MGTLRLLWSAMSTLFAYSINDRRQVKYEIVYFCYKLSTGSSWIFTNFTLLHLGEAHTTSKDQLIYNNNNNNKIPRK